MSLPRFAIVMAIAVAGYMEAGHANVVYTYTGHPFTTSGGPGAPCCSISGSFELASAIAPSSSPIFSPLSFSFTDGLTTVTNINATDSFFWMFTDATGAITGWNNSYFTGGVEMFSSTNPPGCGTPSAVCSVIDISTVPNVNFAEVLDNPGTWTITTPVPEPGTAWLLGLGLAAVAARTRRRCKL